MDPLRSRGGMVDTLVLGTSAVRRSCSSQLGSTTSILGMSISTGEALAFFPKMSVWPSGLLRDPRGPPRVKQGFRLVPTRLRYGLGFAVPPAGARRGMRVTHRRFRSTHAQGVYQSPRASPYQRSPN